MNIVTLQPRGERKYIENFLGSDFKNQFSAVFWMTLVMMEGPDVIASLMKRPILRGRHGEFFQPYGLFVFNYKIICFEHVAWQRDYSSAANKIKHFWNNNSFRPIMDAYCLFHYDPYDNPQDIHFPSIKVKTNVEGLDIELEKLFFPLLTAKPMINVATCIVKSRIDPDYKLSWGSKFTFDQVIDYKNFLMSEQVKENGNSCPN